MADAKILLREMVADAQDLKSAAGGSVTDAVAAWLAPQYLVAAREKLTATDGAGRFEVLRTFMQDWAMLRRGDHMSDRLWLDKERLEVTRRLTKERKEEEFKEWLQRPDVKEKLRPKITRDRAVRRVFNIVDHALMGTPLEDFNYIDDDDPEPPQDPAALI
jgi:hypothetical protein